MEPAGTYIFLTEGQTITTKNMATKRKSTYTLKQNLDLYVYYYNPYINLTQPEKYEILNNEYILPPSTINTLLLAI